ncbi:MAG: DUF3105 domain-containing protein [Candidatus Levybacteria bacterium]|nr:DUF3105 domain-containing protein [Candidatus Levybacteria bacterium]
MEYNEEKLSKKERKRLKKEQEAVQKEHAKQRGLMVKWITIVGIVLLVGAGLWWIIAQSSKPLPGKAVADLGREHVEDGTKVEYNSNPPTSGKHYADWTRAGIFENPVSDGHLIHSLEHGYVVISYNCERLKVSRVPQVPRVPQAYAHEEELEASSSAESDAASPASNEASPSAKLTDSVWKSKDCLDLKKELSDFANGEGLSKLIVIPRPNMDTTIALTAWGRIDTIDRIDKDRMSAFIKVFRNNGPEKTME